ncbi:hypothetical protein [Streptomyces showdoensis]|uniref:hypothetical protein n=1 Tax=Streptomyces showdoensis TaxID=68268 RepID=UPI00103D1DD3|nr:hypothetical protein [Streptomyces showdoensis]
MDVAAKETAIVRFLEEYPQAVAAGHGHPALQGCERVRWSDFPECPGAIPVLLHGLLDETAAPEARRVLGNSLLNISAMNPAVPTVLPFLLRLASDPRVPARSELLRLLVVLADFSEPVDGQSEATVFWFGSDGDRPERAQCRAVFAEHASVVGTLADLLDGSDARTLRQAAGLP